MHSRIGWLQRVSICVQICSDYGIAAFIAAICRRGMGSAEGTLSLSCAQCSALCRSGDSSRKESTDDSSFRSLLTDRFPPAHVLAGMCHCVRVYMTFVSYAQQSRYAHAQRCKRVEITLRPCPPAEPPPPHTHTTLLNELAIPETIL